MKSRPNEILIEYYYCHTANAVLGSTQEKSGNALRQRHDRAELGEPVHDASSLRTRNTRGDEAFDLEFAWVVPFYTMRLRAPIIRPSKEGCLHACPGLLGGVEWNGPAYNAATNMLYVPAVDWCSTFFLVDEVRYIPGKSYFGGSIAMDRELKGRLTAIDAASGSIRWQYDSPLPMVGAVTTTAGGVVLAGELTGDFLIFDAQTGKELLRFNTGGSIGGGIVSYEVEGNQYVAVMSGRPSPLWVGAHPGSPTALVFALPDED